MSPFVVLGLLALVAAASSGSSSPSSSGAATGAAPRTGASGPNSAAEYVREIERLAREELARVGASDVEQIAGAHAIAALALSETGGANEHGNNPGNIRPTGDQPRARWPGGDVYRTFATRADGVHALVALVRSGSRYASVWRELATLANASEPLEPIVAAWLAAIRARGYTPPASGESLAQAESRWLRDGERVATFVSRALSSTGAATMPETQDPSAAARRASEQYRAAETAMDAGTMDARATR